MSDDEIFFLMLSLGLSAWLWGSWFVAAESTAPRSSSRRHRMPLFLAPLAGAVLLFAVLKTASSFDVRDSPLYLTFYMTLGIAWLGVGSRLLALFGLSARQDVIERPNPAAARAIGGALIGVILCFAGGNIGDGPGWWVVVFCAALSTAALFILWYLLDKATGLSDAVTVDRDLAAGTRLAGFFAAAGLILGRAVAGDWVSPGGTVADFGAAAWPVLLLGAVAVALERRLRPTPGRPLPPVASHGWAPALAYLAVAGLAVARVGWWS